MFVVSREANGFTVIEHCIIFQNIAHHACQKVSHFRGFSVDVQHLHFVLTETFHTISIATYAFLGAIKPEPNPVEDRQAVILHHTGKTFIEMGLENDTTGIDARDVFLQTAN
ncbi:unknown [Prevotella sp. CAG:891]|nr:unknown [Prevotella sp. CAG:891]